MWKGRECFNGIVSEINYFQIFISSQYDFAVNQYTLHYVDPQKYNRTTHPKGCLRD